MKQLTNELAKQEAIKKAYGQLYTKLKSRIDSLGFVEFTNMSIPLTYLTHPEHLGLDPAKDVIWYGTRWRPVSLSGLEENNSWVRIEPDGSNLPEFKDRNTTYDTGVLTTCGKFYPFTKCSGNAIREIFKENKNRITHYKPIKEDLPPVY